MKKYLVLLGVLLLPSLVLGVTLEPNESFVCGNNTYTCRVQTCPTCECSYDNCTKFINEELNNTLSTCMKTYEKVNEIGGYNFTSLSERLAECEDEKTEIFNNISTIKNDKNKCLGDLNVCYTEKKKAEDDRMLYLMLGFGAAIVLIYIMQPEFLLKRGNKTTGTEGGYEPTEVM